MGYMDAVIAFADKRIPDLTATYMPVARLIDRLRADGIDDHPRCVRFHVPEANNVHYGRVWHPVCVQLNADRRCRIARLDCVQRVVPQ